MSSQDDDREPRPGPGDDGRRLSLGEGPRMGLGLAALCRLSYFNLGHGEDLAGATDGAPMRRRADAVFEAAYGSGVRYFDTARMYGRGEEFLGDWLRRSGLTPSDVAVGSKWNWNEPEESPLANFEQQRQQAQLLLDGHLRLYQIHSATLDGGVLDDTELLAALARWREASGVALGLSVYQDQQLETVYRALELDLFDSVQATWNLLDPSAGPALEAAHDAGLKVIIKEALANGRLTERGSGRAVELLAEQAAQLGDGVGIDAVALAAVLAQPWVDMVLSGAATVEMLNSNLVALDLTLEPEYLEQLETLAMSRGDYWEQRLALPSS